LGEAAGADVRVSFTPHLMPMSRGMQSTIYVRLDGGASVDDLRASLQARRIRGSCPPWLPSSLRQGLLGASSAAREHFEPVL
jgi:hypothetical protein